MTVKRLLNRAVGLLRASNKSFLLIVIPQNHERVSVWGVGIHPRSNLRQFKGRDLRAHVHATHSSAKTDTVAYAIKNPHDETFIALTSFFVNFSVDARAGTSMIRVASVKNSVLMAMGFAVRVPQSVVLFVSWKRRELDTH